MMSDFRTDQQWDECPPGELSRLAKRLKSTERRALLKSQMGNAALCLVLVVGGVLWASSLIGRTGPGGISCKECLAHFDDYHLHLTTGAPIEPIKLANQMQVHLDHCRLCRGEFDQRFPGVLSTAMATRAALGQQFAMFAATSSLLLY